MSAPFQVADAVRWTGGRLVRGSGEVVLSGVAIDSRAVMPGHLFVAIVGPNHDGHRFADAAVRDGAAALLVAEGNPLDDAIEDALPVIEVTDTTTALGELAAGHRALFDGPVIAITGSSGKTTTKEMCGAILAAAGPCLKTEGNLNNEFGLPLTLLRRETADQRAVVELGMNHRGEIARLALIARPNVALVTNIGLAHVEFLGSREEIAQEKGDLYAALPKDGIAVANRDDPLASRQAERGGRRIISYSCGSAAADVRASSARFLPEGRHAFEIETPAGRSSVRVTGLGDTTVTNATAAAAAALAAGVSLECITVGLAAYHPPAGRMSPHRLPGGATVIDDSYNANPGSMRASLETLAQLRRGGRGIAVLGDMGELGEETDNAHRDTGRWVAELGIDFLYTLGDRAEQVVAAAVSAGMDPTRAKRVSDSAEASSAVQQHLEPHDWVLIKGSRAMRLERVVEALRREIH